MIIGEVVVRLNRRRSFMAGGRAINRLSEGSNFGGSVCTYANREIPIANMTLPTSHCNPCKLIHSHTVV